MEIFWPIVVWAMVILTPVFLAWAIFHGRTTER
jgi:hypothetical protein